MRLLSAAGAVIVSGLLVAGALLLARWWRAAGLVPDHAPPIRATAEMKIGGPVELMQRVRVRRAGLAAVDVLLRAEAPDLPGWAQLRVEAWPGRLALRTARLPAALPAPPTGWLALPQRPPQRWATFTFEPLPDSAGREYLLVFSYPEGQNEAGRRLAIATHFPNSYPYGELLVNGSPADGTLMFRLAGAGTNGDAVRATAYNLARGQPVFAGTLLAPGLLAGASAALLVGLARQSVRFKVQGSRFKVQSSRFDGQG
jgi:hypothetical protein